MDQFNYNSLRAREARAGKILSSFAMKLLLWFLLITAVLGFVYLCFWAHNSLGWLLLAVAIPIGMMLIWIQYEIGPLPPRKGDDINNFLSKDVLCLMMKDTTPQNLASQLCQTRSGAFMALRFGLGPNVMQFFADGITNDLSVIMRTAREIWRETEAEVVSGGILMVAMIKNHPEHEMLLKRIRLEMKDLYTGINWYNYWNGIVKGAREKHHDGGIARDLTFGYIPLLEHFGINLSEQNRRLLGNRVRLAAHREVVGEMIGIFSGRGRQNVALVGPDGSGRSTIVRAFAEVIMDADAKVAANLKYRQVFVLDAATLVSAAQNQGDLEGLVMRLLGEAYAAKNIIVCLENAHLFFEEGIGSVDISNVLAPILKAGNLRMILTMNEQKYLEISARNSTFANALNKIMVPVANYEETLKVLQDQAPVLEEKYRVVCTYWSLLESYRLGERYVHETVMPAQALNLLEVACNYAENGLVTAKSIQEAVEKTVGVKVQVDSSENDRAKLLNLESLIHQRMVDQEAAVKAVSGALRRAAAGVRSEKRPIGTFLFLGPTGVGKTELAKALAEVYFGGEGNIVRLDMNEFVMIDDVGRLIADGTEDSESLTAQVMKHPFSVVLLDEIEKAHPQVLTTLLQLLDEGILRDARNREVSFRDTIVIATSNAGAERIREYVASGATDFEHLEEELTSALISEGEFRPEFLNRFDEICVFKPLSKEDLLQIVDLMVASVNQTLAAQKITVSLSEDAKAILIERGYDPQMGARPMRRIIQKTVENLVAELVLSGVAGNGAVIRITGEMLEQRV